MTNEDMWYCLKCNGKPEDPSMIADFDLPLFLSLLCDSDDERHRRPYLLNIYDAKNKAPMGAIIFDYNSGLKTLYFSLFPELAREGKDLSKLVLKLISSEKHIRIFPLSSINVVQTEKLENLPNNAYPSKKMSAADFNKIIMRSLGGYEESPVQKENGNGQEKMLFEHK